MRIGQKADKPTRNNSLKAKPGVYKMKNLDYSDIADGVKRLVIAAKKFRPNWIFGINRGGAIVGGLLAKQLNQPTVNLLTVNLDFPPGERVQEQRVPKTALYGKIMLVDDAARTGEHMREAYEYLHTQYPRVKIHRVVMLKLEMPSVGPEQKILRYNKFDTVGYLAGKTDVKLPWDV